MNPRKGIVFFICLLIFCPFTTICKADSISDNDEIEYWAFLIDQFPRNNSFALKKVLLNNGWEEDHILAMQAINTTCDEFTEQDFLNGLAWLSEHDDSNDISLIFTDSHGSPWGLGYICPGNNGPNWSVFNDALDQLHSAGLAVIIGACFSGNSIPYLKKDGRVIITSCEPNITSGGLFPGLIHQGFSGPGDYIGDQNDIVSIEEVYNYSRFVEDKYNPQMQDDYPGSLNLVNLSDDSIVDQMQLHYVEGLQIIYDPNGFNTVFLAQSFIPSANILTKVKLNVQKLPYGTDTPLIVSIKENLSGDDLTSVSVPANYFLGGSHAIVEFDFDDVSVTPGKTYYIVCKTYGESWSGIYRLMVNHSDTYGGGELYMCYGSDPWVPGDPWKDMFFITCWNENNQSSPQNGPSSNTSTPGFELILIICAIALVLFWKRKRKL